MSDFPRLAQVVEQDLAALPAAEIPSDWRSGPVSVALEFGFADSAKAVAAVDGRIDARVDAVCQRCLEPFRLPLGADFRHVLTAAGEAYGNYGVWELAEDTVTPADLVEEALMMALPLSPAHASVDECGPLAARIGSEPGDRERTAKPFAALRAMIEDKK